MLEENLFEANDTSIQFCSLGSGSKGNGTLVAFDDTIILVDCGFSIKETIRRLALKGIAPQQLTAILVTHEHSDHVAGVSGFSNKFAIPVWLNKGTSLHKKCDAIKSKHIFNSHHSFKLANIEISPVPVPHDSREATQFIFTAGSIKLGLLTDVGQITEHIIDAYSGCAALMLEFNYDYQMLIQGNYPYALKQRVSGGLGHLSNDQAISFLERIKLSQLRLLAVMHKSEENNTESIIKSKLGKIADLESVEYFIASQSEGFNWRAIVELQ